LHVDRHDRRRRRQFAEGQPWRRLGELPSRDASAAGVDAGVVDVKIALTILIVAGVAGCSGLPKDGRYQTGGGGWDNFRAEAPVHAASRWS
jgi:hypothetical protein